MTFKALSFYLVMLLIPFLVLELMFRILPVSNPPYIMPVSSGSPVAHLQPNHDYQYSQGWNFSIRTHKHTNNYGFNNKFDYNPDDTPLLMVIGDSYVQANQIDSGKSAAELIHYRLNGDGRAYSAGLSGAPLSQYLAFAEYSADIFRPDAMVFVVVGNDFDESLLKYKSDPRFHYFREEGGQFILQRVDYKISGFKKVLRSSAFIRYLMNNMGLKAQLEDLIRRKPEQAHSYVGNMPASVDERRMDDSKMAVDEFFRLLPLKTGLDNRAILFVLDGMRPALYSHKTLLAAEDSFFSRMREYFTNQAHLLGYEILDMQPVFIDRHRLDNSEFEFETDGHWNEVANNLVANEIQKSGIYRNIIEK